jgi:Domain of unknown function (DUF397)
METRTMNPSWRKSSYSTGNGGQCVETGNLPGAVLVRDTTDRCGLTLSIPTAVWQTFVTGLK